MKKTKSLVVLDLDDTQFPALPRFKKCLSPLMNAMAHSRGVELETIEHIVREANGQHRFNDGAALVQAMVANNAILKRSNLTDEWQKADQRIQSAWIDQSHNLTVFFPGVIQCLQFWKMQGVRTVIQTDCEDIAAIRNLWMLGQNAFKQGQLESPLDVLDFYDAIYCQQGIPASEELLQSIDPKFYECATSKLKIWNDRLYKPTASHIVKILDDANVHADEAVYIGDSHKDGAEASSVTPAVDFAWSKYGTHIDAATLGFCSRVASSNYAYGEDAITSKMNELSIQPSVILERSMSDVLSAYTWFNTSTSMEPTHFPKRAFG